MAGVAGASPRPGAKFGRGAGEGVLEGPREGLFENLSEMPEQAWKLASCWSRGAGFEGSPLDTPDLRGVRATPPPTRAPTLPTLGRRGSLRPDSRGDGSTGDIPHAHAGLPQLMA